MRDISIDAFAREPSTVLGAAASEAQVVRNHGEIVMTAGSDQDAHFVVPEDGDDELPIESSSVSTPFPRDSVGSGFLR
jgi:hypothetical protein